jgi:hypothetical protein
MKPCLVDDGPTITDADTEAFLEGWISKFETWIGRFASEFAGKAAA